MVFLCRLQPLVWYQHTKNAIAAEGIALLDFVVESVEVKAIKLFEIMAILIG